MEFLVFIILVIVVVVFYIHYRSNQKKMIKAREEKISLSMSSVENLKRSLKEAKDNAESAKSASEAKYLAETVLEDISKVSFNLNKVEKDLQGLKQQSLKGKAIDCKVKDCEAQISDLSKKIATAKNKATEAVSKKIAQTSRVPYTVLNIPFLTSKFIVDYSKSYYVKYSISDSTDKKFPIIRVPRKNCEIKLPVIGRKNNRGASEQSFCNKIVEYGLQAHFYDNLSLFCGRLCYPYEPDLAFIDAEKGIFLDIEIDEPYIGSDRTPIHYKTNEGTIDDVRNEHFTERGWCVIRFSEKQIYNEPLSCLKKIFELLHRMDTSIVIPSVLTSVSELKPEDWWSKASAEAMERRKEREKYLNISEFKSSQAIDIKINDYERGRLVEQHIIEHKDSMCWNECIRNNNFAPYKLKFPNGNHANEVPQKEDDILWKECDCKNDYLTYIRNH